MVFIVFKSIFFDESQSDEVVKDYIITHPQKWANVFFQFLSAYYFVGYNKPSYNFLLNGKNVRVNWKASLYNCIIDSYIFKIRKKLKIIENKYKIL